MACKKKSESLELLFMQYIDVDSVYFYSLHWLQYFPGFHNSFWLINSWLWFSRFYMIFFQALKKKKKHIF